GGRAPHHGGGAGGPVRGARQRARRRRRGGRRRRPRRPRRLAVRATGPPGPPAVPHRRRGGRRPRAPRSAAVIPIAVRARPVAVYALVGLVGGAAFLYPFWLPSHALPDAAHAADAPLVAAVVGALVVAA